FEVILDRIPDAKQKPTRAKPVLELSPFQPVSRDFAFIVDRSVKAGDIVRAAQGADRKLVTDVTVFDVYEGRGIDEDRKSIAVAFVSATARGFSGFGSALIFMPLASSMAAPRLVAALLLIIDFVAAAPLVPNAWKHADRKATAVMVSGALIGVPIGTYFLSRLDPVTTRWIISAFVLALLMLLLSGWRYRGEDHPAIAVGIGGLSGFCSGLAQTGGPP